MNSSKHTSYGLQDYNDFLNSKDCKLPDQEKAMFNKIFVIYKRMLDWTILNDFEYYFYSKEIFIIGDELVSMKSIKKHIELHSKSPDWGSSWEDVLNDATKFYSFLRIYIVHFPIFLKWDDVYINKDTIKWMDENAKKNRKTSSSKKLFEELINSDPFKMVSTLPENKWKVTLKFNKGKYKQGKKVYLNEILEWDSININQKIVIITMGYIWVLLCTKLYCKKS